MLVALLLAAAAPADPADFTLAVPFTDDMVLKSGSAVRPTGGAAGLGWLGQWGVDGVRGCCTAAGANGRLCASNGDPRGAGPGLAGMGGRCVGLLLLSILVRAKVRERSVILLY